MIDEFKQKTQLRIDQLRYFQDCSNCQPLFRAISLMEESIKNGGKILVFGNGGSATQSSHFAAELVNKFYFERRPLPGLALVSDIANLTAIANDSDYRFVFSRQLETLGKPGDVAMGLSTSGRSPNVLEALSQGKKLGLQTIALCGKNTDCITALGVDVILSVPSTDTPTIQEMHLYFLHTMAEVLEKKFFNRS
ncbi:MAG: SIS domain-containing protein [Candidatus Omnitrophota bacterium]